MESIPIIRFNIAFCKYIAEIAKITAHERNASFVMVYDDEPSFAFINNIVMRIRAGTITITHVDELGDAYVIAKYELFKHEFDYRFEPELNPSLPVVAKRLASEIRSLLSDENNGYSYDNKDYIICIPGDEIRLPFEMLEIKSTDEVSVKAEY